MELIGGLVIVAILIAAAGVGLWAKMNPATGYKARDESGVSEAEWQDSIK